MCLNMHINDLFFSRRPKVPFRGIFVCYFKYAQIFKYNILLLIDVLILTAYSNIHFVIFYLE